MVNSVSVQTLEFLYSALLGAGLGVLFDVIRVLRSYIPKSRVVTAVLDVLFWILAIIALFAFVLTISEGRMRWYVLLGVFSGGFVYMAMLSEIVFKVLRALVLVARRALSLLTRPIYLLFRGAWRAGKKTERKLLRDMRNMRKKHLEREQERKKLKRKKRLLRKGDRGGSDD